MINPSYRLFFLFVSIVLMGCNSQEKNNQEILAKKKMLCKFFFIPDCPASKACFASIVKLEKKYAKNGLEVHGILSDPSPNDSILFELLAENKVEFKIIPDSTLSIAKSSSASTTPQFILYDSLGSSIYSGLIDNYYYEFGKHRVSPTINYLEDAIIAYLEGEEILVPETKPIGCKINFDALK